MCINNNLKKKFRSYESNHFNHELFSTVNTNKYTGTINRGDDAILNCAIENFIVKVQLFLGICFHI